MDDFLTRNQPAWEELAGLIERGKRSMRRMKPSELRRLDVLYRLATVHLAQVSTRSGDQRLVRYLSQLVSAAHALIYLPPRESILRRGLWFIVEGFARTIARTWRYHTFSALLIVAGAILAYEAGQRDPLAIYALMPAEEFRMPGATADQLTDSLREGRNQGGGAKFGFASFLFQHNLKVGILSMGLGVLAAVPTVLLLLYNGMILGAFTAVHAKAGIREEYWAWILPHGITEIGAITLCGGIGLMLGRAVVCPGELTRTESLGRAGLEGGRVALGVAGMLFFAAVIESYLRQSHLSTHGRLTFALGTGIFWTLYIAHGFIRERWATMAAPATNPLAPS